MKKPELFYEYQPVDNENIVTLHSAATLLSTLSPSSGWLTVSAGTPSWKFINDYSRGISAI
jgi:hypothetical protein